MTPAGDAIEKAAEALLDKAEDCFELAKTQQDGADRQHEIAARQRASADKQTENANRLVRLGHALEADAANLHGETQVVPESPWRDAKRA